MEPEHFSQMHNCGHPAARVGMAGFWFGMLGGVLAGLGLFAEAFLLFHAVIGKVRWSIFWDTRALIWITGIGAVLLVIAYALDVTAYRWAERDGIRFR